MKAVFMSLQIIGGKGREWKRKTGLSHRLFYLPLHLTHRIVADMHSEKRLVICTMPGSIPDIDPCPAAYTVLPEPFRLDKALNYHTPQAGSTDRKMSPP